MLAPTVSCLAFLSAWLSNAQLMQIHALHTTLESSCSHKSSRSFDVAANSPGIVPFDEDLNQIEQGERGFRRGGDEDEVEGRVVAVCDEGRGVVVGLGRARGGGGGRGQ